MQVDFIAFTGLECLEKATLEKYDEIEGIASRTIEYLEDGIRRSWNGNEERDELNWVG